MALATESGWPPSLLIVAIFAGSRPASRASPKSMREGVTNRCAGRGGGVGEGRTSGGVADGRVAKTTLYLTRSGGVMGTVGGFSR